MKKEHYCFMCECEEFNRIEVDKKVTIKKETFISPHVYFVCTECGERYADFENPNQNLYLAYTKYRKLKNLLSPEQIKRIRVKYGFSLRTFAGLLGISYSTLSTIENGSLQNDQQNSAFIMANKASAMKDLVNTKKNIFSDVAYNEVTERINKLIFKENEKIENQYNLILDKLSTINNRVNLLEYDLEQDKRDKPIMSMINSISGRDKYKWKETFSTLLKQN